MRHLLLPIALLPAFASAQNTYDARIDGYRGHDFPCDGQLTPVLRIQNVGTATMATCVVETWKNGVMDNSFNWILAVPAATNEYRQPALPPVPATDGDTLEYRIISVNGNTDEGAVENIVERGVEDTPLAAAGYTVQVEVLTDDFPGETTWVIRAVNGSVVAQGGPYTVPNNLEVAYVALDATQCYQFEVYDSGNDGINAGSRSTGYARVKNLGATLVDIDGASFADRADDGLKTGGDPCAPTALTDTPTPVASCGATGLLLNGTQSLYADAVPGANKYQFRFTNVPGQPAYTRQIASPTNSQILKKWSTLPLKAGRTYNVQVRASFDNGATWCAFATSCTITISNVPNPFAAGSERTLIEQDGPQLSVFPNPAEAERFQVWASDLPSDEPVVVELIDGLGRVVVTRNALVAAQDNPVSFAMDGSILPGMYLVRLSAGTTVLSARLLVR